MAETIVILPGWGSDLTPWQPVKKLLSAGDFKVFLPLLPDDQPRNTNDYSLWLKKYTQSLNSFILVGHSFGGQIAINFTAKYPQKVKKLVLINSAGIRRKFTLKRLIFWPIAKLGKSFLPDSLKQFGYRLLKATDYFAASPIMKQTLTLVIRDNQETNLVKITCPTLIIWGKQDRLTPVADGRLMHKLIKNSQLKVLVDARHGLPFTHPEALVSLVVNFINSWFIFWNYSIFYCCFKPICVVYTSGS